MNDPIGLNFDLRHLTVVTEELQRFYDEEERHYLDVQRAAGMPEASFSYNRRRGSMTLLRVLLLLLDVGEDEAPPNMTTVVTRLDEHSVVPITTSAMTGSVDVLASYGLVERVHDPSDRRSVRVRLMERGRERLQILLQRINEKMRPS